MSRHAAIISEYKGFTTSVSLQATHMVMCNVAFKVGDLL